MALPMMLGDLLSLILSMSVIGLGTLSESVLSLTDNRERSGKIMSTNNRRLYFSVAVKKPDL